MVLHLRNKRRTLMSFLLALGLATTLFMYFQFFSVEMIDHHNRQQKLGPEIKQNDNAFVLPIKDSHKPYDILKENLNIKGDNNCDEYGNCDNKNDPLNQNDIQYMVDDNVDNSDLLKINDLDHLLEENIGAMIAVDYPRGVKKELAMKYKPDDKDMFTCLHSKEKIPFSQVNDDYCDCADSSDEPGTSACNDNRFYCTFQVTGIVSHDMPSNRVNDGICDCCDGSDEWKNIKLPAHVLLEDSEPHYGIYQSPCKNHCHDQIRQAKEILLIHQQGAALKKAYIKEATGQDNPHQLYGNKGEFYKLGHNCYSKKSDKYEYTVCPFKEAKQQVFPGPSTVIGRDPTWVKRGDSGGPWQLKMAKGDSKQCPGLIKRESIVYFECGMADKVLSVQETEVCQYSIKFATPAAC